MPVKGLAYYFYSRLSESTSVTTQSLMRLIFGYFYTSGHWTTGSSSRSEGLTPGAA